MCGRFAQVFEDKDVARIEEILRSAVGAEELLIDSYNIAPSMEALIGLVDENGPRLNRSRFGLVPAWVKDRSGLSMMNNARVETVTEKPAFRGLVESQRCVVPVSGFYEWETVDGMKRKQPWYIKRTDGEVMMLAGLWDRWDGEGELVDSFTLLTTEALGFMTSVHHRMPMVLEAGAVWEWMDVSSTVKDLVFQEGSLIGQRVSRRVNSVRNDDAGLLEEVMEGEIEGEGTLWGD